MARKKKEEIIEEVKEEVLEEIKEEIKEEILEEAETKEVIKEEIKKEKAKKGLEAEDDGETLVVAPKITVEAAKPAVNNVTSELVFPKKLKLKLSTPLITFCIFLITVVTVGLGAVIAYGVYYVTEFGIDIDFGDKVDLSEYQAMVEKYETTISGYETTISEYQSLLDSYAEVVDKYESTAELQSANLSAVIEKFETGEETSVVIPEEKDAFTIYYYDAYDDIVKELIKYCSLKEGEDVILVSYGADEVDSDQLLDADLVLYETGLFDFSKDDFLSSKELGFKKGNFNTTYDFAGDIEENAFNYMVCPGYIQIRADFAEKYLGTTDPEEIYDEYFCDFETMANTANMVYKASKGKVALFGSTEEVELMYDNALEEADMSYEDFIHDTDGSFYDSSMWDENWMDYMAGTNRNKKTMAVVGTTWFSRWILDNTAFADNNTILVKAPVSFYWGGESVAAPADTSDIELAKVLIDTLINDSEFGLIVNNSFDETFMNNVDVVENDDFTYDLDSIIYDKQDYISFIESLME